MKYLASFVLGAVLALGAAFIPESYQGFIVRPKAACIPPEGIVFKQSYIGRGTVVYKIVPPTKKEVKK